MSRLREYLQLWLRWQKDRQNSTKSELAAWNNGAGIDLESWTGCEGRFALAVGYAAIFWKVGSYVSDARALLPQSRHQLTQ